MSITSTLVVAVALNVDSVSGSNIENRIAPCVGPSTYPAYVEKSTVYVSPSSESTVHDRKPRFSLIVSGSGVRVPLCTTDALPGM